MDILLGALGALLTLGLFAAGIALGWALRGRFGRTKAAPPDEDEMRRLKAEQEAFRQLTHYSAAVAYGVHPASDGDPFEGGSEPI